MISYLKVATLALAASTGVASAATVMGQVSFGGRYATDDGSSVGAGDTINVTSFFGAGGVGDYAGIETGTSPFSLIALAKPDTGNVGTSFTFGDFSFEITSTEVVQDDAIGLQIFGFGDVTGGGFDVSESSYRFSLSGDGAVGSYSLFIATPPEDIAPIPLPAGLPLLLGGIAAFAMVRRRVQA